MNKSLKIQSTVTFVLSILGCLIEVFLIAVVVEEMIRLKDPWTTLGFHIISIFLVIFQAALFWFAVFNAIEASAEQHKQTKHFTFCKVSVILSTLTIALAVVANVYFYRYF